uniref:Uncharacterized protein n=1 Tax=Palpitomonas bilix TaxID=652834 RepID=A0A7S3CW05_9EUKA|mmetsp:Transcript_11324/g.29919  ORF Transcript_11324/g.29919 Transcript_11324/m.29919 type:complete len:1374 (+) Transcript_11324:94-4215(+)
MGVPKYFRWVSERYPLIRQKLDGEGSVPEIDNFYLDVNGIIHHCSHGENMEEALSHDQIAEGVFQAIDKLFQIAKPKKYFFIAVDGVAPRAKMNQQRSRRTRAGAERMQALEAGDKLATFDSNCITPGTEFMDRLEKELQFFVKKKVAEDVFWRRATVIFSGHSVPGEGEHKIIEFMRKRKDEPGYDPNEVHCWQGLDADLVFLALSTHEPHTMILRSEVTFGRPREGAVNFSKRTQSNDVVKGFEILHVSLLREYIELEFDEMKTKLPFEYDLERIIDDYVFLAFFVGNDFLPTLPTLNIKQGALQMLFEFYRECLPTWKSYLTCPMPGRGQKVGQEGYIGCSGGIVEENGAVFTGGLCLEHVEDILAKVGAEETDSIASMLDEWKQVKRKRERSEVDAPVPVFPSFQPNEASGGLIESFRRWHYGYRLGVPQDPALPDAHHFAHIHSSPASSREVVRDYLEGLLWVRCYYTGGVGSWTWYYPHHYAPFSSDFVDLHEFSREFSQGFAPSMPFPPLMQLLSVLPIHSRPLLPKELGHLMVDDQFKAVYPEEVAIDMEGKQNDWEGVVLLPFLDIASLEEAARRVFARLNEADAKRNAFRLSTVVQSKVDITKPAIEYKSPCPRVAPSFRSSSLITKEVSVEHIFGSACGYVYRCKLLDGVLKGIAAPAGIPSLFHLPYYHVLKDMRVSVFGGFSRLPSISIQIEAKKVPTRELPASSPLIAERLKGQMIYVDYPYLRPALVTGVIDGTTRTTIEMKGGVPTLKTTSLTEGDRHQYKKHMDGIESKLKSTMAVEVDNFKALLIVKRVVGVKEDKDGKKARVYAESSGSSGDDDFYAYPLALTCLMMLKRDMRLEEEVSAPLLSTSLPIGSDVIVTRKEYAGYTGQVVEHRDGLVIVALPSVLPTYPLRPYYNVMKEAEGGMLSLQSAARLCKTSNFFFSILMGQVFVNSLNGTVDAGLRLKFDKKGLSVLGMARKGTKGWEFAPEVVEIFGEYRRRFPTLIRAMEKANGFDEIKRLPITDLFPVEVEENFERLKGWLDSLPVRNAPLVKYDSFLLPASGIQVLLQLIEGQNSEERRVRERGGELTGTVLELGQHECAAAMSTLPLLPHEESTAMNAVGQTVGTKQEGAGVLAGGFKVGDRVVCKGGSSGLPFGAQGFVIGAAGGQLCVLLDKATMVGTSLSGSVPKGRGILIHPSMLLNLSPYLHGGKVGMRAKREGMEEVTEAMSTLNVRDGVRMGKGQDTTEKAPSATGSARSPPSTAPLSVPVSMPLPSSTPARTMPPPAAVSNTAGAAAGVAEPRSVEQPRAAVEKKVVPPAVRGSTPSTDPASFSWDPVQYWAMLVRMGERKQAKRQAGDGGKKGRLSEDDVRSALRD